MMAPRWLGGGGVGLARGEHVRVEQRLAQPDKRVRQRVRLDDRDGGRTRPRHDARGQLGLAGPRRACFASPAAGELGDARPRSSAWGTQLARPVPAVSWVITCHHNPPGRPAEPWCPPGPCMGAARAWRACLGTAAHRSPLPQSSRSSRRRALCRTTRRRTIAIVAEWWSIRVLARRGFRLPVAGQDDSALIQAALTNGVRAQQRARRMGLAWCSQAVRHRRAVGSVPRPARCAGRPGMLSRIRQWPAHSTVAAAAGQGPGSCAGPCWRRARLSFRCPGPRTSLSGSGGCLADACTPSFAERRWRPGLAWWRRRGSLLVLDQASLYPTREDDACWSSHGRECRGRLPRRRCSDLRC